jgi:hypothetical protein
VTTAVKLVPTAVTVGSGKPSTAFGQQAKAPLEFNAANIYTRAALSPEIPVTAVVDNGLLTFRQATAAVGSTSVTVQRAASPFNAKTTWNNKPGVTGTAITLTKSAPAAGTLWVFDVTADVQAFVDGSATNYGWKVTTTNGTRFYMSGAVASTGKPTLTFDYETLPDFPQNLTPNGAAVSVAKPVLSWDALAGTTAVQVQIDNDADGVSPVFDSGEVAQTASTFPLAATAYAGLADGATTSWRVRVRTPGGLSGWSAWATFSRAAKGVITVTNPGATSADGSPPFQATFTETVTQWRVTLRDTLTGALLDTSGWVADPVIEWTPTKGVTVAGQQGTFTVEVIDDVARVATPGDPVAAVATQTFTLTLSGAVAPLDSFVIEQRGASPAVYLIGTRSEIPDEVAIFRDGVQIARVPGLDVFDDTAFEWADYTAAPNWRYEYRVAPVVDGAVASGGTVLSIKPTCVGLWLIAEDDGTSLYLSGDDSDVPEATDLAVVHQPATGNKGAVRRRMSRPPVAGTASGVILDVPLHDVAGNEITAADMLTVVADFAASDQGRLYRFVVGHLNLRVIAGDFIAWPTPLSGDQIGHIAEASFTWWGQ